VTSSGGWRTTAALISSASRCEIALTAPQEEGNDTNSTHAHSQQRHTTAISLIGQRQGIHCSRTPKEHPGLSNWCAMMTSTTSGEAILRVNTALQSEQTPVQNHSAARILCHKSCRRGRHAPNAAWLMHARNGRLGGRVHKLLTGRPAGPPRKNCTLKPGHADCSRDQQIVVMQYVGARHERPTTIDQRPFGYLSCSGRPHTSRQRPTSRNDCTHLGVNTRLLFVLCEYDRR
jgi:hypothetical protein